MALEGLAGGVTREAINVLLLGRAPGILDDTSDEYSLFEDAVRGATSEIVPLIGSDPDAGAKYDLAVRCIAYCAAAEIEFAVLPEQQGVGDQGRGNYLLRKYNDLRAQLQAIPDDDGPSPGETQPGRPRGSFPPAGGYPDPVVDYLPYRGASRCF